MKNYDKLDQQAVLDLLFHPRDFETAPPPNAVDVDIEINDQISIGCRLHMKEKDKPLILYFHGNGETISDYDEIAQLYLNHNINLLVSSYRGYGRSGGVPTVTGFMEDCHKIFTAVCLFAEKNELTGPLFVMGRSIGTAAAIEIASCSAEKIKGLIVESVFAETMPLLENIGINTKSFNLKEEDGFGNIDKIAEIKTPTLILHGAKDTLIPIPQAERIQSFSGAKAKKFFIIPGADHNTTIAAGGEVYFSTIRGFINDITGEATWRERRRKYRDSKG